MRVSRLLSICAIGLTASAAGAGAENAFKDTGLFTTYSATPTSVSWSTCGVLDTQHSCFGSGSLSPPFGNVCAVMEGQRSEKGKTVTRKIYVLDKGTTAGQGMTLYVFTRTDKISGTKDVIKVSQPALVFPEIGGGPDAHCLMAADAFDIYIGTDVVPYNAEVSVISTISLSQSFLEHPSGTAIVSITAEQRNYVALHFSGGSLVVTEGEILQTTNGPQDMADQHNAWKPN